MNHYNEEIRQGTETAFINSYALSNLAFRPEFVSNNYKQGRKVLTSIENELLQCDSFSISVAFITMSGITPLLQTLKTLEEKGIKGRILTTNYLKFTEPRALEKLNHLSNIELKMYDTGYGTEGFHTKGYIFKKKEIYKIIVGSSNMTLSAMTTNKEWNLKIVSTSEGEYVAHVLDEFEELWNCQGAKSFEECIELYRTNYELIKQQKEIAKKTEVVSYEQYRLKPNKMQVAFVNNLRKMIESGEEKALLISATGTGKTYASAFAIREINPKRMLFIVHREQIAKQAIRSYKKVFGNTKTLGLLSGNSKEYHTDFVFATMQTISKDEVLGSFQDTFFDVIVLDEAHHVGNASYQKIMNYFNPTFWLGMTASPDTNNYDIYSIFHHNIAYEIRLQQALEEDLLCPFHYFGITDIELEGRVYDDSEGIKNFSNLISEKRVEYIIEKANYFGYSGNRVKGVIFCSRKDEARELSKLFNKKGYKTSFLCGEDSQEKRELCISQLTTDEVCEIESGKYLDYIFTVDIFNEGVDIVEINQVIMLRPTESPIIFIQQLGRGLRKSEGKEFIVVLDFIGNYMNNFMIPIALSGDRTYNKDTIRRYMMEGSRIMLGASSIHFDEISKQRIFSSIDKISMTKKCLQKKYQTKNITKPISTSLIKNLRNG